MKQGICFWIVLCVSRETSDDNRYFDSKKICCSSIWNEIYKIMMKHRYSSIMFHVKHEDNKKELQNYLWYYDQQSALRIIWRKTIYVIHEIVSVDNFESIIDPALDLFVCTKMKTSWVTVLISTCLGYAKDLISFAAFSVINTELSEIASVFSLLWVLYLNSQSVQKLFRYNVEYLETDVPAQSFFLVCQYESLVLPDLFHVKRAYMVNPLA